MQNLIDFPKLMTTRFAQLLFLIVLFPACAGGAMAATDNFLKQATGVYTITPQTIIAKFSVGQLPIGSISGRFLTVLGKFILNGSNLKKSSVSLTIQPISIKTTNPETDAYLRGPDFFHVAKFSNATFKSTGIKRTGNKTAELTGILKIRNISLPMTFNVTFQSAQKNTDTQNRFAIKFNAKGAFKRSKYGMSAGIPIFSDTVKLDIQVTGVRK